jgi:carboxypeptidase T
MKPALLALALAALAAGPAPAHDAETATLLQQEMANRNVFKAWFPSRALARRAAISLHGQLLESRLDDGYQVFELDPVDQARLRAFGFRLEVAEDFIRARNARLQRMQRAAQNAGPGARSIPSYACYETVEESFAQAQALAAAKPQLASWIDAGNSWQKASGSGGYDLGVLKLSNAAVAPPPGQSKPKLFINSAIHAREYATAPLVLEFARQLVNGHGVDADATWVLDHHELHLMLHTNPDGRKRAETGLSWRKNTNNNHCANSNTRGVDLNRNFSQSWNVTNGEGSSGSACSLTYRGPSAGSEPETQAVEAYVRSLWPDRRGPNPGDAAPEDTSGIHLDIHSFSQLVLWPWGDSASPAPNGAALATLGRRFAWFNGYTPMQSVGLYPTDGTSDAVSYGELGVPAYTFELGTSFFESCATFTSSIKPGNLPALMYAAKVVRAPYLTPSGPQITELSWLDSGVVAPGGAAKLQATASDLRFNQSEGSEATQAIAGAEAYVDTPPWLPGAVALPLSASDGRFDAPTEALAGSVRAEGLGVGRHLVYLRARDASGAWGPFSALFLDVAAAAPPLGIAAQCTGLQCNLKATGGAPSALATWTWQLGDGRTASGQRIGHLYAQAGSYTVALTARTASGTQTATREVTVLNSGTVNETEPNNSLASAQALTLNPVRVNGVMDLSGDADWFSLNHEAGKTLTVLLQPNAASDYDLFVYDANGVELARSENGSGAADSVSLVNSAVFSQRRYVRVLYYSGGSGATNGRYTLDIGQ